MSEPKKRASGLVAWVSFGILLTAAYGGAYAMLAEANSTVTMVGEKGYTVCWVYYSLRNDQLVHRIFRPANSIDRKLLPNRWPGEFVAFPDE